MYPGITDLINDLFGTRLSIHFPPTFGTLVAISFLLAAFTLRLELLRREKDRLLPTRKVRYTTGLPATYSEIFWSGLYGFILFAKVALAVTNSSDFFRDPQSAIFSLQGNLPAGLIGAALFGFMKYREKEKQRLPQPKVVEIEVKPSDQVTELTMMAALGGLIGAKMFHLFEYWSDFIQDPLGMIFSGSGLTMYGGLIVGAVTVLWYGRRLGISALHLCDSAAPGLMLAYGTGRLGCQLSGDGDWGIVNTAPKPDWMGFLPDWFWSFRYPNNVIGEGVPIEGCTGRYCFELAEPVFPTPLYESIACILLFFVLWSLRKRLSMPGQVFFLYLLLNGVERFLIELIRVNSKYNFAGLSFTQAQLISTLLILSGAAGFYFVSKRLTAKHQK